MTTTTSPRFLINLANDDTWYVLDTQRDNRPVPNCSGLTEEQARSLCADCEYLGNDVYES
jgi:hypothetical protein